MLTLLTYNLYLGADLSPVLSAPTPDAFDSALDNVLGQMEATDFRLRARLLAQEISAVRPDLIALQEAVIVQAAPVAPSEDSGFISDYLQGLLSALRAMGHEYWPVSVGTGPDITCPPIERGVLRFTNRTIILARSTLLDEGIELRQAAHSAFGVNVVVSSPVLGTFAVTRGWTSIDVYLRGASFRLVAVHLEDRVADVRRAQAADLIRRLNLSPLPVVLVGDFNTHADRETSQTYAALLAAGFEDTWRSDDPLDGATCCQAPDLHNDHSMLRTRIDLILKRGALQVRNVRVIGNDIRRRRAHGLWPSDHAGVVGTIHPSQPDRS